MLARDRTPVTDTTARHENAHDQNERSSAELRGRNLDDRSGSQPSCGDHVTSSTSTRCWCSSFPTAGGRCAGASGPELNDPVHVRNVDFDVEAFDCAQPADPVLEQFLSASADEERLAS